MNARLMALCGLFCLTAATVAPAAEAHLMRYADVAGDRIVFTYENDLWTVPAGGGLAQRITSHPGNERFAKFSPDGRWLAFSAEYDGNQDIYVVAAEGGIPRRLTFHPGPDVMVDWHPDGEHVLFRSRRAHPHGVEELFLIPVDGGMPEKVAVDRGGLACYAPDGRKLAYNRIGREARTWKRYRGGMAQDVWVADLDTGAITRLTDFEGTDSFPMWHGAHVYFLSDREDGTLNLYRADPATGAVTRLTTYRDYDVKYPSVGDGRIVYQYAESLHLLDLATGRTSKVDVQIASDLVRMRPELVEVAPRTGGFGLSPSGKRVLLEARGEILNLPAEEGIPVDLSRTSASRERNAVWSPDGRWIAFVSDRTGEEEIFLLEQKGEREWRQLTRGGKGFLLPLVWSPDSRHLLYGDKAMRLNLLDVDAGSVKAIAQGDYDDAWERWGIQDYVWSPDSRWIAYSKMEGNLNESLFLYEVASGKTHRATDTMTTDWSPSFSPCGKYLYFLSNRTFNPIMGFQDQNHIFLDMARPYVLVLADGAPSPFAPADTPEAVTGETDEKEEEKKDGEDGALTVVDPTGLAGRVVAAAGVAAGNYFRLEAIEDGFLFLKKNEPEFLKYQNVNDHTGGALDLVKYSLEDEETETLLEGIANYHLSADGKKLIYRAGSRYGVVDAGKPAKVGDGAVDLDVVKIKVTPAEEFAQILDEAWRIQRDWFYDPGMHGVDWPRIHEKYRRFVPSCGNRGDLNYLIGEMIGELNIGHTYVFGGDFEPGGERVRTGLLGADFAVEEGAGYHRIAHVIPGLNWDEGERSPLAAPGCPIREGHYLIAIDGEEVPVGDNVFRHLEDTVGKPVTLTYNDRPEAKGAKTCLVEPIGQEYGIRYREWVDRNRERVAAETDGRIGYLHLPDMSVTGLIEFAKGFFPQYDKEAMIIDERYNGGGFVGDMIIDRLERGLWALTQPREGKTIRDPERCFHGPWIVLVNENTGSNGEYFAEAIQIKNLAPVMGVRTWGGAVGIEAHQDLVDGGVTTPPQFAPFGVDGTWLIEGRGVEPDIVVMNAPADVVAGRDEQLERAIAHLLEQLRTEGERWRLPARPPFPDKSKPGE